MEIFNTSPLPGSDECTNRTPRLSAKAGDGDCGSGVGPVNTLTGRGFWYSPKDSLINCRVLDLPLPPEPGQKTNCSREIDPSKHTAINRNRYSLTFSSGCNFSKNFSKILLKID